VLELRPARLDDPQVLELVDEVQRWYEEIYGGRDDDPTDPAEFAPPRGRFLLGLQEGRAVAMGGWTRVADSADVKIRRMYVRPAGRRSGFAGTLLDALEDEARRAGARRALLTTGTPQTAAIAFYRARGYADVPAFGFYADSPTAVHLGKAL